ncbi:MAG TPA: hypothetical protein VK989_19465 [Polyangia bacterium]|jgi:hypothetical protein|nr:hypothetical protein [Polyangia bacterium]
MSHASPAIIEVAEEPALGLASLRDVAPPPALVARVMTRVAEPVTPTLAQWLTRPVKIELRISPLGILAIAGLLAAALALFVAR